MNTSINDVNVTEFIDRNRMSGLLFLVVTLSALVILLDGFDTQVIAYVAPVLAPKLGVKPANFGPVFGIGLLGLTLGALIVGPIADYIGRRVMIIFSVIIFGTFSLLTVRVATFQELLFLRFLTGLGLGAAMPNTIALTAEYAPSRVRATLVAGIFAAFPLGSVIGGVISAKVIPIWGWQAVFYVAGICPMAIAIILAIVLPESIRFLVNKGNADDRVVAILNRITGSFKASSNSRFVTGEQKLEGMPVGKLFTEGRAGMTLLLWVPYFTDLLLIFFMYSWLPLLMGKAGLPISEAIFATVLFSLGGVVGALVQGTLIDRFGYFSILGLAYLIAAICVGLVGYVAVPSTQLLIVVFLAGLCAIGAQCGANALATNLYPTSIRATGVGWALGIGRIGSIIGPVVGGILLSLNWDNKHLFVLAAIPGIIATIAIILLSRLVKKRRLLAVWSRE